MIRYSLRVGVISVCVFALSAVLSYKANYDFTSDNAADDIEALEHELRELKDQIQILELEKELMPIEHNWLAVLEIIARYPDVIWRAGEDLGIAKNTETNNAWHAVMIAAPDLLLPVMRLIQRTVPAEVSEIQLNRQQSVLSVNVLGVLK